MKQTIKKYSGVLLTGAIIAGGVAGANFDFSTLPGADTIKSGAVIKADDILALSTAIGTLDTRATDNSTNITTNANTLAALKISCADGEFMKGYDADGNKICENLGDKVSEFLSPEVDPLPYNITLSIPGDLMIASVHDENYLPIESPDATADTLVDIQGTLDTTGRTLSLAYEVRGSSVDLPAFSQIVTVPAEKTEDGQARNVIFSYPAQTLSGSGKITATIKTESGILNAKKLDIDQNIQHENWLELTKFAISVDSKSTTYVKIFDVPGIPDAQFGDGEHDFLYMPVVASDGTIWLNNTLGAEYNNIHSSNFNPAQQATAQNDYLAYGSLFQWGRLADGHELRTCTDSTTCTSNYGSITTKSSILNPGNNLFIKNNTSPYDWMTIDSDGWQRAVFLSKTNGMGICPAGYRVPTETELETTRVAENITDDVSYFASVFKGVLSGYREYSDASFKSLGGHENLLSSTADGEKFRYFYLYSSDSGWGSYGRSNAFSVRCIEDL